MTDNLFRVLKEVGGIVGGGSVYYITRAAFGGACALIADRIGKNPFLWFSFGLFLPLPPLYFWFSSDGAIRRRLIRYKAMADEKLITPAQFRRLRSDLLKWYAVRQFGRAGLEMPDDDGAPPTPTTP